MADLYNIYLDESGTHEGSEAVAVAGFIANTDQWNAFSAAWQGALREWGIDYFHMTDFENRRQQFSSWIDSQRKERLNFLLDLINQHTISSIGYAIEKTSFDQILSEKAKYLCGDAYGLAAIGCFLTVSEIARDPKVDGWIDYVMESRNKGTGALKNMHAKGSKDPEWLNNTRVLGLSFRDKRIFLPLQAADILAYEIYKHLPRQLRGDGLSMRYPLKQLHTPHARWHYPNDNELKRIDGYLTNLWDRMTLET